MRDTNRCSRAVAMAARLVSPYPLVWSTGLARAGVGCQGAVSDQVLAGRRGAGRGWGPRSTAAAGFGILADPARGVRGPGPSSTQPESPGSHHCSRASTPSTAARGRMPAQKLPTDLPHTGHPHMAVSTVWAGAGRRPWQHSTRRWTPAMLTIRPSTTALSESASHLP